MKRFADDHVGIGLAIGLVLLSCILMLRSLSPGNRAGTDDQLNSFSRDLPPQILRSRSLLAHHIEKTAQTMGFGLHQDTLENPHSDCQELIKTLGGLYPELRAVHLYDRQLERLCSAYRTQGDRGADPIAAKELIQYLGAQTLEGFLKLGDRAAYRVIVPCFDGQTRRGALEVVFGPEVLLAGVKKADDGRWIWGEPEPSFSGPDRGKAVSLTAGVDLLDRTPFSLTYVHHDPEESVFFSLGRWSEGAVSILLLLMAVIVLWRFGLRHRLSFDKSKGFRFSRNQKISGSSSVRPPSEETDLRILSQAVEQSNVAVMVTDMQGIIEYVNQKFLQLIGYEREEVLGQTPRLFKSMATPMEVYQDLWQTLAQGESWSGEFYNRKKSGELFWDETYIAPVRDDGGRIVHYVAVKEDITERKRMEVELITTKEAAEAANRAKSHFLANMSHEIRTPMNAIIGMTELTLKTDIGEEQREYLKSALVAAERLLSILDDVLDLSKIESGVLRLDPTPFSLRDQLTFWMKDAAEDARQKGLEYLFDVDDQVPDALIGDFIRLEQIVTKLLENAVKFTTSGGILLRLEPAGSVDGRSIELHFMISDTGLGIAEDKQEEIFEKFSQADVTATRRYGGTGLGLTLCSELVGMMRGRIWVESPSEWAYGGGYGPGSTFHFTVWIGRLDDETRSLSWIDVESLSYRSVILLFKNQMRVRMMKKWLEEMGLSVRVAMNFLEAWKWMLEDGPALLQTDSDYWPPAADLERALVESERLPAESRIFVYDDREIAVIPDFLDSCAAILPRKPISKMGLMAQLSESSDPKVLAPLDAPRGAAVFMAEPVSLVPRILVVEDNSLNQKLVSRLLGKKGYGFELADNGLKAVEAVRSRSFDLILMDIQMPELDGVSATRILRQEGFSMPIIALTAHALKGDRESYLGAGMNDYLGKPIRQDELYSILKTYLDRADL